MHERRRRGMNRGCRAASLLMALPLLVVFGLALVAVAPLDPAMAAPDDAQEEPPVERDPADNCPAGFEYRPFTTADTCFQVDLPAGAGHNENGVARCLADTPYGFFVPRPTTDGKEVPGVPGRILVPFLKGCFDSPQDRAEARDADDEWEAAPQEWKDAPANGQVGGPDVVTEDDPGSTDEFDELLEFEEPDGEESDGDEPDGDEEEEETNETETDEKEERGGLAGGVLGDKEGDGPSPGRTAAGGALLAGLAAALAEAIRRGIIRGKTAELYRQGLDHVERLNRREREISRKLERVNERIREARGRLDAKTERALNRLARREERALRRIEAHRDRAVARLERIRRRAERRAAEVVARGQRKVRELRNRLQRRWDRVKKRIARARNRTRILTDRRFRQREVQRAVRRLINRSGSARMLVSAGVTDEKAVLRMLDRLRRDPRREVRRAFRTLRPRELGREVRRAWRRMSQRNPVARGVKWFGDRFGDLVRRRRRPKVRTG